MLVLHVIELLQPENRNRLGFSQRWRNILGPESDKVKYGGADVASEAATGKSGLTGERMLKI